MAHEILVGVNVVDEQEYQRYRDRMYPILQRFGGDFITDLDVSKVRKSPLEQAVNRVFTIRFESEQDKETFFTDADYLAVRQRHFDVSVSYSDVFAAYDLAES